MNVLCLDLEGVLIPEIWQAVADRTGIEDLLEAILLTAEEIEPRANPKASPSGTVLEARMERGLGVVTTVLVQNGTLRVGDTLLVGDYYGRIKSHKHARAN